MLLTEVEIVQIVKGKVFGREPSETSPNLLHQDSRKISKNDVFICIQGEKVDGHSYIPQAISNGASVIIGSDETQISQYSQKNPDVLFLKVADLQTSVHELAKACRRKVKIPVLALTGASGKTTTKDFLVHIISDKHKVLFTPENNNNLWGVPLTLVNISNEHSVCVLETGTNAPGEVRTLSEIVQPTATYTTSIGESHLEFLKNIEGVLEAETEQYFWMMKNQKDSNFFLNISDKHIRSFFEKNQSALKSTGTITTISSDPSITADFTVTKIEPLGFENKFGSRFTIRHQGNEIIATIPFPGIHNVSNALAALAVSNSLKLISVDEAIKRLMTATITGLRSEIFKTSKGSIVYNDSYNANPSSMKAALNAVSLIASQNSEISRRIAVVGDMKELGSTASKFHIELGEAAKLAGFNAIYIYGEYSEDWKKGFGENAFVFSTREELLSKVKDDTLPGDIILIKASHGARLDKVADGLR